MLSKYNTISACETQINFFLPLFGDGFHGLCLKANLRTIFKSLALALRLCTQVLAPITAYLVLFKILRKVFSVKFDNRAVFMRNRINTSACVARIDFSCSADDLRTTAVKDTHTHTHSPVYWVSRYQKVKPIWILLKQETVSGSGISWAVCKSAPRFRQITTPAPHHSVFLQAGCPSCHPTNSVKALKITVSNAAKISTERKTAYTCVCANLLEL